MTTQNSFLEFFAGGGMTRLGLGKHWKCLLANDIDSQKCAAYRNNFGNDDLIEGDIATIDDSRLPTSPVDLMWGSFPCQDLSLAGARGGINANRSSAFFPFWQIAERLAAMGNAPKIIAIENVTGLLTSNGGRDFQTVVELLAGAGYRVTARILDASHFTPQSRPRLFILAFQPGLMSDRVSASDDSDDEFAPIVESLSVAAQARWFRLPDGPLPKRNIRLTNIIDWDAPEWDDDGKTQRLLDMMSQPQRKRVDALIASNAKRAGTAFRRTRHEYGKSVQRVEARFDGVAGCLRTPAGGSSRQIVVAIDRGTIRTRLMTPKEAAALMGLPDDYHLPASDTAALKLCGDGVCVPVVRWLAANVFEPVLLQNRIEAAA